MTVKLQTGIFLGILIVGGFRSGYLSSAETYNPVSGHSCSVADLPQASYGMSLCHRMVCGGGTKKSCLMFDGKSFSTLPVTLLQSRWIHMCWGLPSGEVLLFGGHNSRRTTERVSADGSSSSADFNLAYNT